MRAVLVFHGIDDSGSNLSFPVRAFAALVHELLHAGVPIVTFERLNSIGQGVTLTFDDAIQSVRRNALPILREAAVPAHLFVVAGRVGLDNRWEYCPRGQPTMRLMDWDEIACCVAGGLSIENHTATHPDLRGRSAEEVGLECSVADETIERRFGRCPRLFAYPYGRLDDVARNVARVRYVAAFTTDLDYVSADVDLHAVPRIDSHYLLAPMVRRNLLGVVGRAYVGARRTLRALRDMSQQTRTHPRAQKDRAA